MTILTLTGQKDDDRVVRRLTSRKQLDLLTRSSESQRLKGLVGPLRYQVIYRSEAPNRCRKSSHKNTLSDGRSTVRTGVSGPCGPTRVAGSLCPFSTRRHRAPLSLALIDPGRNSMDWPEAVSKPVSGKHAVKWALR